MRRRSERAAEEPSTKYGALPMRRSRQSMASPAPRRPPSPPPTGGRRHGRPRRQRGIVSLAPAGQPGRSHWPSASRCGTVRSTARGGRSCSSAGGAAPEWPVRTRAPPVTGTAPRPGSAGRRRARPPGSLAAGAAGTVRRRLGRHAPSAAHADGLVQGLVLGRRHLGVPVAAAGEHLPRDPAPAGLPTEEEGVEHAGRGDVEEDVREVLAADQVDVVDAQVDGRHLVARGAARALPLDHPGQAPPQAVLGGEEGLPVRPRGVELCVEGAAAAETVEAVPHLGRQAVHHRRARPQGLVDARSPSMPRPVPSSVTVVRSLGTDTSSHRRPRGSESSGPLRPPLPSLYRVPVRCASKDGGGRAGCRALDALSRAESSLAPSVAALGVSGPRRRSDLAATR